MKKCPVCNADIEENARFCLYCMTPLEEKDVIVLPDKKKKRLPYFFIAALIIAVIILLIFMFKDKFIPSDSSKNTHFDSQSDSEYISDTPTEDKNEAGNETQTDNSSDEEQKNSSEIYSEESDSQENEDTVSSDINTDSVISTPVSGEAQPDEDKTNGGDINTDSEGVVTPTAPPQIFTYRDAQYGDDFAVSANLKDSVVITGVKEARASGEYIIPETIDGKKVIAIMGLAFCGENVKSTVKKIVVPSTVKTIWNNAFAECYNLTDIYFCGNAIYTEEYAFPESSKRNGKLTIHCSAACHDRNYRYYKNSASNYDAEYKEWNG